MLLDRVEIRVQIYQGLAVYTGFRYQGLAVYTGFRYQSLTVYSVHISVFS